MSGWQERVEAFHEPSERVDSYGEHKCGCTWDSGPYGVFCDKHDPEDLGGALLAALVDALERGHRDADLITAARSFLRKPHPPT